jgi:two-component system chemotaxis sensor kinase CheA
MQLEEILDIFFSESSELLQRMETTLLSLEENPQDPKERLEDLFRSVHTIKGSAGIFALDDIVQFTHHLESALDLIREGKLEMRKDMISFFIECRDLISELIEDIANKRVSTQSTLETKDRLIVKLKQLIGGELPEIETPPVEPIAIDIASSFISEEVKKNESKKFSTNSHLHWHISIRYKKETFRHGLDPISILRYLEKYGEIKNLFTYHFSIPDLKIMNVEECHLGFEIVYHTDRNYDFILDAFEFVQFDSDIRILPPGRTAEDIFEFIQSREEPPLRLVRILLYLEAITDEMLKELFQLIRNRRKKNVEKNQLNQKALDLGKKSSSEPTKLEETVDPKKEELSESPIQPPKHNEEPKKTIDVSLSSVTKEISKESKTIRIDSYRLDLLINQVGELVILGANLNQFAHGGSKEDLQEIIFQLNHLISEIRDTSLNLRMVQIGETFSRFQRVVRDISAELGKEVELKITGGDTELDKLVIEKIIDPLTHLVRNALDHGIETKEERIQIGKNPKGVLHLNAFHEAGNIVIEVKDDGRGLNKEKIYKKALEKGLISEGKEIHESEILRLIFRPGFSTASKITNISGRGVGLDVVEKNISSLRGSVEVFSEEGKGINIQVRLPLTLAIIDGFLFKVGSSHFVVPLDQVVECIEYKQELMDQEGKDFINLRGKVLPFFRLSELFAEDEASQGRKNILVLKYAGREVGLLVDSLLGEFQTVIKPMNKIFKNLKGISGTTILGNGSVALVLDVPMIYQLVNKKEQFQYK